VQEKPAPHSRADVAFVGRQLFPSRAKAQEAIAAGLVRADGKIIRKASEPIGPGASIEAAPAYPWVSRGKLAAALDAFGFDPTGRVCLYAGASTGGFPLFFLRAVRPKSFASIPATANCMRCSRAIPASLRMRDWMRAT
jgi:23S rRNA (cytidine1920-2'-O)/16S rRNA (cytidine1409-2'-O)-methyltransferase